MVSQEEDPLQHQMKLEADNFKDSGSRSVFNATKFLMEKHMDPAISKARDTRGCLSYLWNYSNPVPKYMVILETKIAIPLQRKTIVLIVSLEVKRIACQLRKPLFSGAPFIRV